MWPPMKSPNPHLLRVDRDKVCDYLLNDAHRYGATKARFLRQFGFTIEAWEVLAAALREHGRTQPVVSSRETRFGTRHEVDGVLTAPDGRHPNVWTVWQVDRGQFAPRLLTAYPVGRQSVSPAALRIVGTRNRGEEPSHDS